jgi:hypothetical protein
MLGFGALPPPHASPVRCYQEQQHAGALIINLPWQPSCSASDLKAARNDITMLLTTNQHK